MIGRGFALLYVATVHFESPRWIEIQREHLRKHLPAPFQVWTSLEGIDGSYASAFDRVLEQRGEHAGKLNNLAQEISHVAAPEDLIMFMDGDAFPIADPMPTVDAALARCALVAVRRAENVGEPQPHPCFCVTTVGAWRSIPGDWSPGPTWPAVEGKLATDVGANLMRNLQLSEMRWEALLRSNGTALHPLFYALYGDIVYHHGAGFRDNVLSRADHERLKASAAARQSAPSALARIPGPLGERLGRRERQQEQRRRRGEREQALARINETSTSIYEAIRSQDPGWLERVRAA